MNDVRRPMPMPPPPLSHGDGFSASATADEFTERIVDEIEMLGEEEALGIRATPRTEVTPGMRYLHCSRTIHQLVTDRNRAVGVYLAVTSLMWTASGAILNAKPVANLLVPIESIQRWCLPTTAASLTLLAVLTGMLLIRTRIGLIYEVAKMNALLGLPVGRVRRVNPLSVFFVMHLMVSFGGGASAAFLAYHLWKYRDPVAAGGLVLSAVVGLAVIAGLVAFYIVGVQRTTADNKLQSAAGG